MRPSPSASMASVELVRQCLHLRQRCRVDVLEHQVHAGQGRRAEEVGHELRPPLIAPPTHDCHLCAHAATVQAVRAGLPRRTSGLRLHCVHAGRGDLRTALPGECCEPCLRLGRRVEHHHAGARCPHRRSTRCSCGSQASPSTRGGRTAQGRSGGGPGPLMDRAPPGRRPHASCWRHYRVRTGSSPPRNRRTGCRCRAGPPRSQPRGTARARAPAWDRCRAVPVDSRAPAPSSSSATRSSLATPRERASGRTYIRLISAAPSPSRRSPPPATAWSPSYATR